jgi:hypothetical protein
VEGSELTGSQYPQPPSQQPQYEPPPPEQPVYTHVPPPKKKFPIGKIVGIVIIILVVVAVIIGLQGLSTRATLMVNVYNYNSYSIDYELFINGELEDSDSLPPGFYMEYTLPMHPGSECKTYDVSATSTGGGGTDSDSETVRLCAGETKTVDLHV